MATLQLQCVDSEDHTALSPGNYHAQYRTRVPYRYVHTPESLPELRKLHAAIPCPHSPVRTRETAQTLYRTATRQSQAPLQMTGPAAIAIYKSTPVHHNKHMSRASSRAHRITCPVTCTSRAHPRRHVPHPHTQILSQPPPARAP